MKRQIKVLTFHDSEMLLEELQKPQESSFQRKKGSRDYLLAVLLLDAGLRIGEAVQLKISDLWTKETPKHSLLIRPEIAKRHMPRYIPLSQRIKNATEKCRADWWMRMEIVEDSFAFTKRYSKARLTVRQAQRIIEKAGWEALKIKIHPHMLRHTFATRLMRTTNIRVVQALLGHKQLSSTQIYTHPNSEDLQDAIDSLDSTNSTKT